MALRVLEPGLLTTVQDTGRWGYQNLGVPVAGPMDRCSHRLANRIVGNSHDAATLEVTLTGPTIECGTDVLFAVTGAEFDVWIDERHAPLNTACRAPCGSHLRFGARKRGARAYMAVAGGVDVSPVLGSRATHVTSRMGGVKGRPVRAGDELTVGRAGQDQGLMGRVRSAILPLPEGGTTVRVMRGPQDDRFPQNTVTMLGAARYRIAPDSDRMGYRLEGPSLPSRAAGEMLSEGTMMGTLQVPPSGQPILLMADCQTAGGFPKLATVISADLPRAGQLAPGDWIEFEICSRREALASLIAQERLLLG